MTTTAREARWNAKIRAQRKAQRKRRALRLAIWARTAYAALIAALGGRCAICEDDGTQNPLSVDHVNGITWQHRKYNVWTRVKRYWQEYREGVPLRVLCIPCNSRQGRPEPVDVDSVPF